MGPIDLLFHLFGFAGPALALGLLMPLAGRWALPSHRVAQGYWRQAAIGAGCGLLVLLAGLWWFGRDGKMATYAVLVLVLAAVQWMMARGWRR